MARAMNTRTKYERTSGVRQNRLRGSGITMERYWEKRSGTPVKIADEAIARLDAWLEKKMKGKNK